MSINCDELIVGKVFTYGDRCKITDDAKYNHPLSYLFI